MIIYNINFQKLKANEIDGIFFDKMPWYITRDYLRLKDTKYVYPPIPYIDESIQEHITQIIFLLKEYFTNKKDGFSGWNNFTENELQKLVENDKYIYINHFNNGETFVKKFPDKINYFLNNFCYIIDKKNI